MKLARIAACGVALLTLSVHYAAAAPALATNNVNMRQGPGMNYPVVTTIPGGSNVEVNNCYGEWCSVTWNGQSGYAVARNLDRGHGAPPAAEGQPPPPPAPGHHLLLRAALEVPRRPAPPPKRPILPARRRHRQAIRLPATRRLRATTRRRPDITRRVTTGRVTTTAAHIITATARIGAGLVVVAGSKARRGSSAADQDQE